MHTDMSQYARIQQFAASSIMSVMAAAVHDRSMFMIDLCCKRTGLCCNKVLLLH